MLHQWARGQGHPNMGGDLAGDRPDLLSEDVGQRLLYVGDAKDSQTETIANPETMARITAYLREFADRVASGKVTSGNFAIATNDEVAAHEWAVALAGAAATLMLVRDDGTSIMFQVDKVDSCTWIVHL